MDELHELVMQEALQGVAPRPGAMDLLARLTDAGIPLAVASNSERAFLERTLSSAGLLRGGPFAGDRLGQRHRAPQARAGHLSRGVSAAGRRAAGVGGAGGLADRRRRGGRRGDVRDRRAVLRRRRDPRREPAGRQPRRPGRRAARSACPSSRATPARQLGRQRADGGQQGAGAGQRGRELGVRRARTAAQARRAPAQPAQRARLAAALAPAVEHPLERSPSATVASISTVPPPCSTGPRRTR